MPSERLRALELEGSALDVRAIVLGGACLEAATAPAPDPAEPVVVWEGTIRGDGTGPQASYFVRLYADGTGTCQCPAFYFRGLLRRDAAFCCKHMLRARRQAKQAR
jgi:hypothetical protein